MADDSRSLVMQQGWLDRLKPTADGRIEYYDQTVPGLALRVSQNGRKKWRVWYTTKGRRGCKTLGPYPVIGLSEAREAALRILADALAGKIDPTTPASTMADLADDYLRLYAEPRKKPKGAYNDRKRLARHVTPRWGDRPADQITRADVAELLLTLRDKTPVEANRTLALVRKLFGWAIGEGRYGVEANPCLGLSQPAREKPRDHKLADAEIRKLWKSCAVAGDGGRILQLMLVTGQRGGEWKGARWEQIEGGFWTIPGADRKGRKDSTRDHRVPLSELAIEILGTAGEGKVFQTTLASRELDRIRKASGVDFRPHDLRHTAATGMGELGIEPWIISRVLGHSAPGDARIAAVTAVYEGAKRDAEKGAALDRWASKLREILATESPT